MSLKELQGRRQLSLQHCIGQVVQPNGSRPGDDSVVEADNVNIDIINSRTNFLRDAEAISIPLANEFSTNLPSSRERDNFQQLDWTTSNRGVTIAWPRHPLYGDCDSRLRSYATWRQFKQFDTSSLAEAGFYNIGVENGIIVRCFFCAIELVNPEYNVNPLIEHIQKSPNCGYLKQKLGARDLVAFQERISNGTQNSLQTDGNAGETPNASSRNPVSWSATEHIRSPQHQAYSVRLASFVRWPSDIRQSPEEVANAGFYYTGLEDVVRCFACDGGMKNWDPDDDPWIEHARWFPQCPFVRRVKGQEFIDLVRRMTEETDEEEDAVVHSTFQPNNPMADTPTLRNEMDLQTDQAKETSVLESGAARRVIDTGFPRAAVAKAINELLIRGQIDYNADHIINVIREMERRDQSLKDSDEDADSQPGSRRSNPMNAALLSDRDEDTGSCYKLALQQENRRLRQSMQCVTCRKSKRTIFMLPCKHLCLCFTCAERSSICPLCYTKIGEKIKTYLI